MEGKGNKHWFWNISIFIFLADNANMNKDLWNQETKYDSNENWRENRYRERGRDREEVIKKEKVMEEKKGGEREREYNLGAQ